MLTRKEIAELLRITPDTLRKRYETRPDFPPPKVRLSRKTVLWEPADVHKWIGSAR